MQLSDSAPALSMPAPVACCYVQLLHFCPQPLLLAQPVIVCTLIQLEEPVGEGEEAAWAAPGLEDILRPAVEALIVSSPRQDAMLARRVCGPIPLPCWAAVTCAAAGAGA